MRRLYYLILCSLFLLFSCEEKQKSYYIGFSNCGINEWNVQMTQELLREAALHPNIQVEACASNRNSEDQIRDIEHFLQKKVDLLIISPNEDEALTPIIERAYDQGIPVLLVDRSISSNKYTAHVGTDNYQLGQQAAAYANQRLRGRGQLIGVAGLASSSPAQERSRGFADALPRYPGLKMICEVHADWETELAWSLVDSVLSLHDEVDMILCHNDEMAMGASRALQAHPEITHPVYILGTDGLNGPGLGIDNVVDGNLDATLVNSPGGDVAMRIAIQILEGQSFERETRLPSVLVDASNARLMQMQGIHIEELNERIEGLNTAMSDTYSRFDDQRIYLTVTFIALLFVIALLVYAAFNNRRQTRLNTVLAQQKAQLQLQTQQLAEQRDQMAELTRKAEAATLAKLAFFTNVSHDFRTPVTLIADPIRQLSEDSSNLTAKQKQLLDVMLKNSTILLRLIKQVLDFRKFEAGRLPLTLSRFAFDREFLEWTSSFTQLADSHHIDYHVTIENNSDDYQIVADLEKCERIVYNLLSNAFKFTPDGGQINVHLRHFVSQSDKPVPGICFTVSDTGIGLSSENIKHVFETFYQVDEHQVGSGLGLALCKAFCDMHHGSIDVTSNQGIGTMFSVFLPREQGELSGTVISNEAISKANQIYREGCVNDAETETLGADEEVALDDKRETVLVIDDNSEMRQYIRLMLSDAYSVVEAANGEEGLRQAQRYVPNVIICDVMMPIMDGLECCRRLKSDVRTSHIPVALLTAYALDDQRIAGYDCGADAYLTKPFSTEVLRARIRNLIDGRSLLQIKGDITNELAKTEINTVDRSFAKRLVDFVHEHLSDNELDVEQLSSELGLSRVQLYRKVKSITGYAPNELVRIARLKRAKELLLQSDKSVSEVSFDVGFSSSSYFAKCYKDFYGESPTDTARKK